MDYQIKERTKRMTNYEKHKEGNDTLEEATIKMFLTALGVEAGLQPNTDRYMEMYHDICRWMMEEAD